VRGVIFVEEIMKKRLRHRVRVIGILFAFAVSIGPISFIMAAGRNEDRVTQAIHNVQLLAPNALSPPV
jgi:predicted tellurium resistance membrane protein TerC